MLITYVWMWRWELFLTHNSIIKTPEVQLCVTIFAFLTLNTATWAHKEIFGAKFLSFGRAASTYLLSVGYAIITWCVQWFGVLKQPLYAIIEPLLHSYTATVVMQ